MEAHHQPRPRVRAVDKYVFALPETSGQAEKRARARQKRRKQPCLCERCGRPLLPQRPGKPVFGQARLLTMARLQAAYELTRGGITDLCDMADLLGVSHAIIAQATPQRMAAAFATPEYKRPPYGGYIEHPVRCLPCGGALIEIVPCMVCRARGREPVYEVYRPAFRPTCVDESAAGAA